MLWDERVIIRVFWAGLGVATFQSLHIQVINDLALPDAELQDKIVSASNFTSSEKLKDGQKYYDYFVESPFGNVAASVTCYGGRLFALFVVAPVSSWTAKSDVRIDDRVTRARVQSEQRAGDSDVH